MTNYTFDWSIMDALGFISKENPVYLYKILRSDNKNAPIASFNDFIVVKAWSSKGNNILADYHRYFDYYYNGRMYRKQEVGLSEFMPFCNSKVFNIWMVERDDEFAIRECKKWLYDICSKTKADLNSRAFRLMADRDFRSRLVVNPKDGVYEQE